MASQDIKTFTEIGKTAGNEANVNLVVVKIAVNGAAWGHADMEGTSEVLEDGIWGPTIGGKARVKKGMY